MGFGLCFLGFILQMMDAVGLSFLGFALMAWGFYKVSSELTGYKGYRVAAYAAAVAALPALVDTYTFLTVFGLPEAPKMLLGVKGATVAILSAVICFGYCGSTARIAEEGGAGIFALRAKATPYLSALYYAAFAVLGFTGTDGSTGALIIIGKYLVPFLNAWLLFTCFTTITTKARAKREQAIIKNEIKTIERKKLLKKKQDEERE